MGQGPRPLQHSTTQCKVLAAKAQNVDYARYELVQNDLCFLELSSLRDFHYRVTNHQPYHVLYAQKIQAGSPGAVVRSHTLSLKCLAQNSRQECSCSTFLQIFHQLGHQLLGYRCSGLVLTGASSFSLSPVLGLSSRLLPAFQTSNFSSFSAIT